MGQRIESEQLQPTVIATSAHHQLSLRGAPAHPELVEGRGNLVEVERTSVNHHCYGDHCYGSEIANPRIEYGVAMTD